MHATVADLFLSTLHELQKRAQELEQLQSHRADQAVTQVSPTPSNDVFASGPVEAEISHVPSHQYSTSFPHNNDAEGDASTDGEDPLHEELATTLSNPLVPEQPGYLHDSGGGLRYLGHSSTWSFAQQLLFKAHQSPHVASASHPTVTYEASVYNVDVSKYILVPEDFLNLPSYELAVYYAQTVRFRTHPLYHLFDDDDFRSSLSHFYGNMQQFAQQYRIWFVHYLILMAFGKVFTTQRNAVVAGTTLFNRALRLLPDVTFLSRDPIASTELLCCFALYLQSIDYRAAAYVHVRPDRNTLLTQRLISVDGSSPANGTLTRFAYGHADCHGCNRPRSSWLSHLVDCLYSGPKVGIVFRSTLWAARRRHDSAFTFGRRLAGHS